MDEQHRHPQNPAPAGNAESPVAPSERSWSEITGPGALRKRRFSTKQLLLILLAVVLLAAGIWYGLRLYGSRNSLENKIKNDASIGNIPDARPVSADTPLGQVARGSGVAEGIDVSVVRTVSNPKTTGDTASAGMKYVEIDLSVANSGDGVAIVTGTFYYLTDSGKLLNTATSTGKAPDYPNKNVSIIGKEPLESLSLGPDKADASHYLIYQVPMSDTGGKLVWYEGYYDTDSTKLAIFKLQ